MFKLPEAWVWDFWLVDDGEQYHLFFLYASRALAASGKDSLHALQERLAAAS